MTTITTTLTHNASGGARIVAKGKGKQRTIAYDHGSSHERNHGNAAGTLALALGLPDGDNITHADVSGGTHKFVWN